MLIPLVQQRLFIMNGIQFMNGIDLILIFDFPDVAGIFPETVRITGLKNGRKYLYKQRDSRASMRMRGGKGMKVIKSCVLCLVLVFCISCGKEQNEEKSSDIAHEDVSDANNAGDKTAVPQEKEIKTSDEDSYIFLSWGGKGKKFEVTADNSLVQNIEDLTWLAMRGRLSSELVYEGITVDEVSSISESALFHANDEEIVNTEESWVRIPREGDTEAATISSEYRDICAYIEGEDAYIAIQRLTETECWNVWKIPGYGDWMNKSIMIFISCYTGLL